MLLVLCCLLDTTKLHDAQVQGCREERPGVPLAVAALVLLVLGRCVGWLVCCIGTTSLMGMVSKVVQHGCKSSVDLLVACRTARDALIIENDAV